jgi:hypothetical protein
MTFSDERSTQETLMKKTSQRKFLHAVSCVGLLLMLTGGCVSERKTVAEKVLSDRVPAAAGNLIEAPPHVVFFLHGFRDDGIRTFGDMPDLIDATFNGSLGATSGINKNFNVRHKLLKYPTMSDADDGPALSAFDFANLLNTQIISFLIEEGERDKADPQMRYKIPVSINTPYTIVAHSQGGMVAATYLNTCFRTPNEIERGVNDRCPYEAGAQLLAKLNLSNEVANEHYLDHLDLKTANRTAPNIVNLVTLGTPFWGSPVASAAEQDIAPLLKLLKEQLPSVQLQNLAIGSRTSTVGRVWMVNRFGAENEKNWSPQTPWVSRYPSTLKIYNLAGQLGPLMDNDSKIDGKKRALREALHPDLAEIDFVVANQEARTDFIYKIENSDPTLPSLAGRTRFVSAFAPINAAHIGIFGYPSIAEVPRTNYLLNPTFIFIKRILLQTLTGAANAEEPAEFTPAEKHKMFAEKISNFTSEVKFITPIGYHRRFLIQPSQIKMSADNPSAFESLKRPRNLLVSTSGQNTAAVQISNRFYQTYFHTGKFAPASAFKPQIQSTEDLFAKNPNGYKINYSFDIAGFETKTFSAQVMPSFTTYSEVYLKPFFPVPLNTKSDLIAIRSGPSDNVTSLGLTPAGRLITKIRPKASLSDAESKILDLCFVGVAAEPTLPENDRSTYLPDHAISGGNVNQLVVFANFSDEFPVRDFQLEIGETIEVLGRRSTGHVDVANGLTRACVMGEAGPDCNGIALDRYLITSPSLRNHDHVTRTELGTSEGKGLRWIDVNVVDMLSTFRYVTAGISDRNFTQSGSHCLGDEKFKNYLEPVRNRKLYYPLSRTKRLLTF